MNILCFGDSNTYGYRPDGTGRFDEKTRWTCLLQKNFGNGHRIIEEGLCGLHNYFLRTLFANGRRGLDQIWNHNRDSQSYRSSGSHVRNK